jgi:hypothetical protein
MDIAKVALETVELLKMIVPVMFVGLLASNLIFSLPWVRSLLEPIDKITSFINLKCGSVILAFFAHPIAGLSMLSDMHRKGIVGKDETMLIFLVSLIPRSIRVVLMFLAPIAFSTLGFVLGLIYTMLELISRILVIVVGILIGRRSLKSCQIEYDHYESVSIRESFARSIRLFFRTLAVFVPSVFIVMLMLELGFLEILNGICKPVLSFFNLPTSGLVIIAAGTSSMVAGIGVAGSLLAKDAIDGYSALIAIFISSMFHGIVESLRRSLAINISFFGTKLGVKFAIINITVRELACVVALVLLVVLHGFKLI